MTSAFSRKHQLLEWIRVGDLVVSWPEAQRPLAERRAKQIAEAFDPDLVGTLTVSAVDGGKYHVNDGQTRATAVRMLYGDNERVPCVIVPAGDAKRAAQIFAAMNGGRAKPSAMEMFKVAVTANDGPAVAVNGVARRLGLRIDTSDADGSIRAVSAVLSVYKQCGERGLIETLDAIRRIWGHEHAAFDAHIMRGFALFLTQSDNAIDPVRLTRRVTRKFTPGRLLGSAKATKEAFGGSLARAICALLVETYGTPRAAPKAPEAPPPPPPRTTVRGRRRQEAEDARV